MSKGSRKRGKKPEGPLKCDRCNQDFQNSPKRTKHLVSTRRDGSTLMMEVNLCPPCQDHHSLIKFINILGRNAGSEELQQIAARSAQEQGPQARTGPEAVNSLQHHKARPTRDNGEMNHKPTEGKTI